jgi:hypothetical protein
MRWEDAYERLVCKKRIEETREGQTIGTAGNKPLCMLSGTKMQYQMLQHCEKLKVYLS